MKIEKILFILLAILLSSISDLTALNHPHSLVISKTENKLSSYEYQKFIEHSESRLPQYKKIFKKFSQQYHVPWTLLAAVAYQESKWSPEAVSYTGVKGLMQLTAKTAEYVGIKNRENPYESIRGGAFYLKYLYDKTPLSLNTKQRWMLALSAYNIGWGHLKDAQQLARQLKKSPYNWTDLKFALAKLEDEKYHSKLAYGFARGKETIGFVEWVFNYYNLLNNSFTPQHKVAWSSSRLSSSLK